jgi:hypothetical protein
LIDDLETLVTVEAEGEEAERKMELGVGSHEYPRRRNCSNNDTADSNKDSAG